MLIRHGQGSLGTEDYDRLSEIGWLQSKALGERVQSAYQINHRVESGTLKRHRQTVQAMVGPERTIFERPELNEYAVDHLIESALSVANELDLPVPDASAFAHPEVYLDTFLRWFPEVLTHWQTGRLNCAHNGAWLAFHQRVTAPLSSWRSSVVQGQTVIVVTSAGVISTLIAEAIGESLAWQRALNVALYNACVNELVLTSSGQWQIETINCLHHLVDQRHHTLA